MSLKQDLPEHVKEDAVEHLIDELADELLNPSTTDLRDSLNACELQPTTRAAGMAARAAVLGLLEHELGQTVKEDSDGNVAEGTTPDDTAAGDREIYEVAMLEIQERAHKAIVGKPGSEDMRAEMMMIYAEASIALKVVDDHDEK